MHSKIKSSCFHKLLQIDIPRVFLNKSFAFSWFIVQKSQNRHFIIRTNKLLIVLEFMCYARRSDPVRNHSTRSRFTLTNKDFTVSFICDLISYANQEARWAWPNLGWSSRRLQGLSGIISFRTTKTQTSRTRRTLRCKRWNDVKAVWSNLETVQVRSSWPGKQQKQVSSQSLKGKCWA